MARRSSVGRGADKLAFALSAFQMDATGAVCCDLGSHVGGFVDAWLRHGAERVYAVDTGYGVLDWRLRNDPRVVVLERTNALHLALPERVDLVSVDVGWTPQARILPVAASLLRPRGRIVSLVKPQYEADKRTELRRGQGRVLRSAVPCILHRVLHAARELDLPLLGPVETPLRGGKGGNPEFFLVLGPRPPA